MAVPQMGGWQFRPVAAHLLALVLPVAADGVVAALAQGGVVGGVLDLALGVGAGALGLPCLNRTS